MSPPVSPHRIRRPLLLFFVTTSNVLRHTRRCLFPSSRTKSLYPEKTGTASQSCPSTGSDGAHQAERSACDLWSPRSGPFQALWPRASHPPPVSGQERPVHPTVLRCRGRWQGSGRRTHPMCASPRRPKRQPRQDPVFVRARRLAATRRRLERSGRGRPAMSSKPGDDGLVGPTAFAQFRHDVRVQEKAHNSISRGGDGSRSKSASSPASGMASRCATNASAWDVSVGSAVGEVRVPFCLRSVQCLRQGRIDRVRQRFCPSLQPLDRLVRNSDHRHWCHP